MPVSTFGLLYGAVVVTPSWLTHLLHWVPVEAGVYRVRDGDKVKPMTTMAVAAARARVQATFRAT